MGFQTKLFINNEYVDARSGQSFSVINPTDESLVTEGIQSAGPEDIDLVVEAAAKAFEKWRRTPGAERAKCMLALASIIERDVEKLATLETISMGQPISVALQSLKAVAATWRYYAGYCDKIEGEWYPEDGDARFKTTQYVPYGVCAGIAAWNGTQGFAKKMAPAVAVGNTFIFKASEKSPLGAIALGDAIKEAGFPPGVLNIVSGGGQTGALLASHMRIYKISFTGSITSGRKVQEAATGSNLKVVTLELGGKSPAVVFNDANLDHAVAMNSRGFLHNSGQICAACSRCLVQEEIAPQFVRGLKEQFEEMSSQMGDALDPQTRLGPLADRGQYDRVMSFIEAGKMSNGDIVTGGTRKGNKGFFINPTIFLNPDSNSPVYTDEIFGPVLSVKTFKTEEQAIRMANDTCYGLAASVYTSDVTRALRVSSLLEAGVVTVNAPYGKSYNAPFGGMKQSGYGRESGKYGLLDWLQVKAVLFNMDVPSEK